MAITNARRLGIIAQARKNPNYTPEQITHLETLLDDNSPSAAMFQDMFYAQSEATRLMQEAKAAEARAREVEQKAEGTMKNLQSWKFEADQTVARAQQQAAEVARMAVSKVEEFKAKAASDSLTLQDLTLDPTLVTLASQATGQATHPSQPSQTPQRQPTMDNNQGSQGSQTPNLNPPPAANGQSPQDIAFAARMFNIPSKHFELFGTMPDMETIMTEAHRTSRDPFDVWKDYYNVDAKIQSNEQAKIDKMVAERVEAQVSARLQELAPNLQSANVGDFSKVMDSFASPALRNVGAGNTALELDAAFRAKMGKDAAPPAGNPDPNAQAPGTLAQRQTPRSARDEEAEWAKDLGDRLSNIA